MTTDIKILSETNYLRKAGTDFWFSIMYIKLHKYIEKFGNDFNVIAYANEDLSDGLFYVLPFSLLKNFLVVDFLSKDKDNVKRWMLRIRKHQLKVMNCPIYIDVGMYFGNPNLLVSTKNISEEEENDYAIENRLVEIQSRVKQSSFRKKVLANFDSKCCISSINETELIVASHIIPWSHRIETRLDPANGLPLFNSYDKLFDLGYITFNDNLKIIITSKTPNFSVELQMLLKSIENKVAVSPQKYTIKKEYLEYHRDIIFKH